MGDKEDTHTSEMESRAEKPGDGGETHKSGGSDGKQESGWTCESDGYWYENGVRSSYSDCSGSEEKFGEKKDTHTSEGKSSYAGEDGKNEGGTGSTEISASSHTFSHSWNNKVKTRRYDLVQPDSACKGNPRGVVVILQPEAGSCA